MPRNARVLSKTGFYHVMLRGNERKDIFADEEDKAKFLDLLYGKKEAEGCLLYSYCMMDNHVHLVLKEGRNGITRLMRRIATSYATYFNRKYKRVGHLFQDRYKSESIENEAYLLTVIRYVHLNPEQAGIAKADEYKWSSFHLYLRGTEWKGHFPEMVEILQMFSEKPDTALAVFREFHRENSLETTCLDIDEGKDFTDKKAEIHQYMEKFLKDKGLAFAALQEKEYLAVREEMILWLKEHTGLSGRKLAELTGLNRETVRKILSFQYSE